MSSESESTLIDSRFANRCFQVAGPALGLAIGLFLPASYQAPGGELLPLEITIRVTLGALACMATWWLTQCLPMWLTAFVPLLLFPLTGVSTLDRIAAAYVDPTIRLFLAGFLLSAAIARWGLGQRFSLLVLRAVGS